MLSVLIVNWNTRDQLAACLKSIYENPPNDAFEVIVVDNFSTDKSADLVREQFPMVTLVEARRNLGYAAGNNMAFSMANGDMLLTLNPDIELASGQLQMAIDTLVSHPHFGVIAPKLVGTDGKTQLSVRGFPSLLGILGDLTGLGRLFPRSAFGSYRLPLFDYESEGSAPQPMGTFLLFRRSALEAVGDPTHPFDESFPIFFNEVDLLYRLSNSGFRCLYCPQIEVEHLGGASTRQVKKSMIWESHRSLLRFFRKHHLRPWNAPLFPIFSLFVLGGAMIRARGFDAGFRP